ncbi:cytochrome P450 [Rhodococcus aerolatus]
MDTSTLPHPPHRLPLLGDVLGARASTPVQGSMYWGSRLGPVFVRRIIGQEIVFVCRADLVAELCDERRFGKVVALGLRGLRPVVGDGLFTAHTREPAWRAAHEVLAPAFTKPAMQRYHATMVDAARELTDRWDAAEAAGRPVDVTADTTRLTLETIGRTGFGYDFGSFHREDPHPFVAAMVRTLGHAQRTSHQLPGARWLARRAEARNRADIALMNGVVDEVVDARRRDGATHTDDLLGRMLNSPDPRTGELLDPVNVRNQVITFLVAGHETTSGGLSFALYYLARHPEVLRAAQAEVDATWPGECTPGFAQVAKLRLVRRVLDEALRLWPTAPAFFRQAKEATDVGELHFERGDWASVLIPLLHRDPSWGPDPETFDPDRFLPAAVKARPAHVYKPFGTGERACIGRQFALHESVLVLATILHRYDLTPEPGYTLRVQELLTLKPEGFRLTLTRRSRPAATTATASRGLDVAAEPAGVHPAR